MNLGEMRSWVLRTIGRPEKLVEAIDNINSAIEYITAKGDFAADLVEGGATVSEQVLVHALVISTEFPRFRKMKYLRPDGYSVGLKWRDPSRIFVEKAPGVGTELIDVWYRAGDQILLKLSLAQTLIHYGYYAYPVRLADPADENWLLEQMSTAVHAFACALMWDAIGNEAEAKRYDARGEKFLFVHKSDKQDGVSHS